MEVLGVRRDKPTKHNNKRLLRKILSYLKSDHYMLAPLIDHLSSSYSSAFMNCSSSGSGPVTRTPTKQNGKKLEDYLKYDSHMYAPLVVSTTATATGFGQVFSAAKSKRKMVEGANQASGHSTDVRTENSTEEYTTSTGLVSMQNPLLEHQEMVKHMVHNSGRSSALSVLKTMRVISPDRH